VLDAAIRAFARSGFEATKLADVARSASIRRPSLLYHFPSKEVLYEAVVARIFAELGAALQPTLSDAASAFPLSLERLVRTYDSFLADHPDHARIVLREMLSDEGPGLAILERQVAPLLDTVVSFVAATGQEWLRPTLPIRAATLHVISDVLLRHASGPLRTTLWRDCTREDPWTVTRHLFLREEFV